MHDQGMVHGNMKGVRDCALSYLLHETNLALKSNILIDNGGHAVLAGSGLFAIIPDELIVASSDPPGDTTRWVGSVCRSAPEVLQGRGPGMEADIYSLAMVMVEARHG